MCAYDSFSESKTMIQFNNFMKAKFKNPIFAPTLSQFKA